MFMGLKSALGAGISVFIGFSAVKKIKFNILARYVNLKQTLKKTMGKNIYTLNSTPLCPYTAV